MIYFAGLMMKDISYYFADRERLDELSVIELELLGNSFPFDQALQLLSVAKLAGYDNPVRQSTLNLSDRSMVSPEYLRLSGIRKVSVLSDMETNKNYVCQKASALWEEEQTDYLHAGLDENASVISQFVEASDSVSDFFDDNPDLIESDEENLNASKTDNSDMNTEIDSVNGNIGKGNSSESIFNSESVEHRFVPDKVVESSSVINEAVYSVEKSGPKKKKKQKKKKTDKFRLSDYTGLSEYTLWLKALSGETAEKSKKSKKSKYSEVIESVKKSVQKSEKIISEPLAQILASQGHISEALKMYHQLMLKYPEKSVYFAARIDDLLKNKEE